MPNQTSAISAFRQSLPITLTSFINKIGDIGMRVFPMLLVELSLTADQSSLVIGLVKATGVVSVFAGGWLSDRLGSKKVILLSFFMSALGMLFLLGLHQMFWVSVFGMFISFGQGLFAAPLRLLIFETTTSEKRLESLAWLRLGNNGALMLGNAVAYVTSSFGLGLLFCFDAVTSLLAGILGLKWLPESQKAQSVQAPSSRQDQIKGLEMVQFIGVAIVVALFSLVSEAFFVGAAALAKRQFGNHGVAIFSQVYMINTGLCMLLAIYASRFFRNPWFSFSSGTFLQLLGLVLILIRHDTAAFFYGAVILQVLGEIVFASTSQFTLMKLIPSGSRQGTIYSFSILLQNLGKVGGAMLVFQLI